MRIWYIIALSWGFSNAIICLIVSLLKYLSIGLIEFPCALIATLPGCFFRKVNSSCRKLNVLFSTIFMLSPLGGGESYPLWYFL